MEKLNVSFNTIKQVVKSIPSYYIQQGDGGYSLFSVGDNLLITSLILGSQTSEKSDFETNYKSSCSSVPSLDDAIVLGNIANKNAFVVPKDPTGIPLSVSSPRKGDEMIYATHNFCDKCTWFSQSERITENLTDSGDHLRFNGSNQYWIDMISGRVQGDSKLADEQKLRNPTNQHGYEVIVKVDDVIKNMREPLEDSGGDYEVFWEDGYIKFFTEQTGTVTCTYSYASGSSYILKPLPSKTLVIEGGEADVTADVVMTDGIEYNVYGYVDVFAPEYMYKNLTGTISFVNGSTSVSGTGSNFINEIKVGQYIKLQSDDPSAYMIVQSIESNTQLTLLSNYVGSTNTSNGVVSDTYTGVYPSGYKLNLTNTKYKRFSNIVQEAIGSYPEIPTIGSSLEQRSLSMKEFRRTSRGLKSSIHSIPFRYGTVRELSDAYGLELHIKTSHDREMVGESATLTFYCASQ